MNGFDAVELDQPGMFGRLLGRKPKANAIRAIQNILASRALSDLTAADIEHVLSEYLLPRDEALPGLKELYRTGLTARTATDLHLSDADVGELRRIRYILGLDDETARETEIEILREVYRGALKHALEDGVLSEAEKTRLDNASSSFGLTDDVRNAIYKEEVLAVVQQAFSEATKDRRLTLEEEQHLVNMSANLGVKVSHDADTQRLVERFKLLARIENGDIPQIDTSILLQRGERCYAAFPSALHELRTVTKRVSYHGPGGRIRIMKGLSYRYGSVSVNRVTSEELRKLDTGTLYISNKRLLFDGALKNVSLPLKRVVSYTLHADGIRVEKDSGRDQCYLGTTDFEMLGIILEAALNAR